MLAETVFDSLLSFFLKQSILVYVFLLESYCEISNKKPQRWRIISSLSPLPLFVQSCKTKTMGRIVLVGACVCIFEIDIGGEKQGS